MKTLAVETVNYILTQDQIPTSWYNIQADLPTPPPSKLHPVTGLPLSPDDMAAIFPRELVKQEFSQERYVEIPEEVQAIYRQWRPSPMMRARRLEKALDTPAKIYYKYEGLSPSGSHKPNTSIPQVYYNKLEGIERLVTETGAGQWGSSLAMACAFFGLKCGVYMVKVSYNQKPYRRALMEAYGARVVASPSEETEAGRTILAQDPNSNGSLGIAISEAVEVAFKDTKTNFAFGSVLNHVLMHQTMIGQEAIKQLELAGDYPDIVIACSGAGSNFGGTAFPFIGAKLRGGRDVRVIAVEPAACPSLTRGKYAYDFGDTAKLTPMVKMHTLGHDFIPAGIHAGGLRYHGIAPLISHLMDLGHIEARAESQLRCLEAGIQFARVEGILPAPESSHAIRAAIDEAICCRESGESKVILFNLSGHGNFDMQAYIDYQTGKLHDYEYSDEEAQAALANLPVVR
jgi:tryptophan synthase beta chain